MARRPPKDDGDRAVAIPERGWTREARARTLGVSKESPEEDAQMPGPNFVHLHVHSSYSLLEGALPIGKLAELAKADKQPALALTDSDNMFGGLEFSEKLAGYGIQPIVGCALAIDFADTDHGARGDVQVERSRLVLLAAREEGYRSLMRLNSRAF